MSRHALGLRAREEGIGQSPARVGAERRQGYGVGVGEGERVTEGDAEGLAEGEMLL
jgi:hypothetical protein